MTDQELRKLSRSELLQMLITQVEENQDLQIRLEKAETQLADRKIQAERAGSLAEASLALNGIFEAADAAAAQYLENIEKISQQQTEICRKIQADTEKKACLLIEEAEKYKMQAKAEADAYWAEVQKQVQTLLKSHATLRDLLQPDTEQQGSKKTGSDGGGEAE